MADRGILADNMQLLLQAKSIAAPAT